MPEKQFKPTEAEIYNDALVRQLKKFSGNILNTYKSGKLNKYVGEAHTGSSLLYSIPMVGPSMAEAVGRSSYKSRAQKGTLKPEELTIFNNISELQGAKVADVARSTFTDAQVERIRSYTPNMADDEKTNVYYALAYKLESQLAQSVRTNPEIRRVLDIAAKNQASVAKTINKEKARKNLEDQLIDKLSSGDGESYKKYLTERFLGNPASVKNAHFSPLVYAKERLNNFLREQQGFQDLDEKGQLVKKLPDGRTAYYDIADSTDGIQSVDVDDDDDALPKPRKQKFKEADIDIFKDYRNRWLPQEQEKIKRQQQLRFGNK